MDGYTGLFHHQSPTDRLVLRRCTLTTAWLPFSKILRLASESPTSGSTLVDLSLEDCDLHSEQAILQILMQISHWRHLRSLVLNINSVQEPTDTFVREGIWETFIARTAPSLQRLEIRNKTRWSQRETGRGWITAAVNGWTGSPLGQLHLENCGMGLTGLYDLVEGFSRQQPCRITVLSLSKNYMRHDSSVSGTITVFASRNLGRSGSLGKSYPCWWAHQ